MEIRAIAESELDEVVELTCKAFRPNGHERYRQYMSGDPSYRIDQTRVAIDAGRIVATLRVWERSFRIGARPIRMGGIGGVCTDPGCRGKGFGSALTSEAIDYMREAGYLISVLFSDVPSHFYGRLGYRQVPMGGFRIRPGVWGEWRDGSWSIEPFQEGRDIEEVMALFDTYNSGQSGSIERPRDYWNSVPARLRGVLPTVVARRDGKLGGYLTYELEEKEARLCEVAYERDDPSALRDMVDHFLQESRDGGVEAIAGEIPSSHPVVDQLVDGCFGTLSPTGSPKLMIRALELKGLLVELLPEWQQRLDESGERFGRMSLRLALNAQEGTLGVDGGSLQVPGDAANRADLNLPEGLFWRAALGEESWTELEPALLARGISVPDEASRLFSILFPRREVIFWAPDHF